MIMRIWRWVFVLWVGGALATVGASELRVAVASNFLVPLQALVADFERQAGHRVLISSGSTGKLYAQIVNGAPFDVYLAANRREPARLVEAGLAVAESRFTYARGRLALWAGGEAVSAGELAELVCNASRIAVANPATAPYGVAAGEVLDKLGCGDRLRGRKVRGENIAQTFQFVATGNVPLGLIALAQLRDAPEETFWLVPSTMHAPMEQQAVLLERAADNEAARALMKYLADAATRARIRGFGYGAGD